MADQKKRIIELEELTTLTDNDYIAVDNSASGGETKKFKPKNLQDATNQVLEDVAYLTWEEDYYYGRGDIVAYDGYIYVCKVDEATYGSFVSSEWKKTYVERWARDLFYDMSMKEMTFSDSEYTMPYSKGDVVYRYYPHPSNDGFQMRFYVAKADYPNGVTEYVASQWDEYYSLSEVVDALNKETNKSVDEALVLGTASGSIASFTDGSTLPMKKLEVDIEPVQDLHGYENPWVGGSGKNKFDQTTWQYYNVSRKTNATNIPSMVTLLNSLPVGYYTISAKFKVDTVEATQTTRNYGFFITTTGSYSPENYTRIDNPMVGSVYSASITVNKSSADMEFSAVYIYAGRSTVSDTATIYDMQLESGQTATTFAPYSNICPISGWDEVNVTRCGKNHFDKTTFTVKKFLTSDGRIETSDNWSISDYIGVKGGTAYILSGVTNEGTVAYHCFYDKDKNFISSVISTTQNFTTPSNAVYVRLSMRTETPDAVQLELGNTATEYHAYNGHTYTIDLNGTRYGGKVDVVSGVLMVDRVGVDLSSVSFTYDSNNKRWNRQFSDMKNYSARSADLMFEQYQATTSAYTGDTGIAFAYGKDIYIYDANQSLTISGKCIYELATPQTIQLTPTEVKSLLAMNNIFADTGDILDATYVRNANITINELIQRIENLENA